MVPSFKGFNLCLVASIVSETVLKQNIIGEEYGVEILVTCGG